MDPADEQLHLPNFEQARDYAEGRLEEELSPHLLYHGIVHTREEVVPAVKTLAEMEGIQGESLQVLLTAAWFHDIGYVEQAIEHESISARVAAQVLPPFGYTEDQIEMIRGAILATALPQSPRNLVEEILADADLDILGRANFMARNADLRQELAYLGKEYPDQEWYQSQLKFMEGHRYFTTSARLLMDDQKSLNIAAVRHKLGERKARE